MEKLEIGEVIAKLRKEKGLTQEQLANFVGVSTPAVSKWESKVSYPDITMLPTLARFFSITIDELLNYNNILSEKEENEIYIVCQEEFQKDTEKAVDICLKYINKYSQNYNLKLRLASLININFGILKGEESLQKSYGITIPIFDEVIRNCINSETVNASKVQLGAAYMSFKDYDKALNIFKGISQSNIDTTTFIANIYNEKGENKKAKALLQQKLISQISEIMYTLSTLAVNHSEKENIENYISALNKLCCAFSVKDFSPSMYISNILNNVMIYKKNKMENKLLESLKLINKEILSINDFKDNYTKVCFLNTLENIPSNEGLGLDYFNILLMSLESENFENIKDKVEYKELIKNIKEKTK